jgi:predicted NBD/HSP70 family sugar kinase
VDSSRRPAASRQKITTSDIRESNVAAIFGLLRERGALTRADLTRMSGLARPTVIAIVNRLLAEGVILEEGKLPASSAGGRPGSLLQVRPKGRVVAAARLHDGRIETVLADVSGSVIASSSEPRTPPSAHWRVFLESIARQVLGLYSALPNPGPLAAAAVSLPGSIDRTSGMCTLQRQPGWRDIPAGDFLRAALGVPTGIINSVAAGLIGQISRQPEYAGSATLVYIGKGVGSAAIVNGRLLDGASGSAGELGHCQLPGLDTRCACGGRGCLETVTATPYLRREYRRLTGRAAPATLAKIEAAGQADVGEMLDQAAGRLGLAASWMVNIVNPGAVFFGGNAFTEGSVRFLDSFAASVCRHALAPNAEALRVLPAAADASLRGTVQAAGEMLPEALKPTLALVP